MSNLSDSLQQICPECEQKNNSNWFVCRHCGANLKPIEIQLKFWFFWLVVLSVFGVCEILLVTLARAQEVVFTTVLLIGLPLVYLFGRAVFQHVDGLPNPKSLKAVGKTLLLVILLPGAVILSVMILVFVVCASTFSLRMNH